MQENSDNQIALFVRDERTRRRAFNAQALKVLGIDPADARDRGYPLENLTGSLKLGRLKASAPRTSTR